MEDDANILMAVKDAVRLRLSGEGQSHHDHDEKANRGEWDTSAPRSATTHGYWPSQL